MDGGPLPGPDTGRIQSTARQAKASPGRMVTARWDSVRCRYIVVSKQGELAGEQACNDGQPRFGHLATIVHPGDGLWCAEPKFVP